MKIDKRSKWRVRHQRTDIYKESYTGNDVWDHSDRFRSDEKSLQSFYSLKVNPTECMDGLEVKYEPNWVQIEDNVHLEHKD